MIISGPRVLTITDAEGLAKRRLLLDRHEKLHVGKAHVDVRPDAATWFAQYWTNNAAEDVLVLLALLRKRGKEPASKADVRDLFEEGRIQAPFDVNANLSLLRTRGYCSRPHRGMYKITKRGDRLLEEMRTATTR